VTKKIGFWIILGVVTALPSSDANSQYRDGAVRTARWLQATAISDGDGVVWRADPTDPKTLTTSLYAGTPGPILFLLETARSTGDATYLATAHRAADALVAAIPTQKEPGLYAGLAGTGFTLGEAYLVTRDDRYRTAALECVKRLQDTATTVGRGAQWNETTDIIAGGAGVGLFLLWVDQELHAPGARDLAIRAGRRLVELAQEPAAGQRKWMMSPTYPRELPNFSHGTAGVAYFLATLYRQTQQAEFLGAALAGGRYLISIADQGGDVCLIRHNDTPEGRHLYYLSWCHGPAGTARLFYRLYQTTSDATWLTWTQKAARAAVASGAPQKVVTPGEWDNVSVCCGVTGQAQFFLDMYEVTKAQQYLDLARKASDLLVAKATTDEQGMRWVQAETRVKPEVRVAQTGLMQGASGIGLWLLHFDDYLQKKRGAVITLPDNPFTY